MNSNNYTIIAFAVVDTNVIISSMLGNRESYAKDILELVQNGNIILLYDERVLNEYQEVLLRFFTDDIVNDKMKMLIEHGYLVTDIEKTKMYFKDKDDIPFFEIKESAKELSPYLITKNTKDFPSNSTDLPEVVIKVLRYLDSFVIKNKEAYLQEVKKLIESLDKEKYIKGIDTELAEKYHIDIKDFDIQTLSPKDELKPKSGKGNDPKRD